MESDVGRLLQGRVVRLQRRHGHPVLTFVSLAPAGRMMRLTADDAVIPRSPPDGLSVEGGMVLIRVGSGIQVHGACTVYVGPSAASGGRPEEVRCGRSAAHPP